MNKVFITGATGFVGKHLIENFLESGKDVRYITRGKEVPGATGVQITDLNSDKFWENSLGDSEVVIHCMARVHVMKEDSNNPYKEFKKINVDATKALAMAAKKGNIKKFIFISTVGVYGNKGTSISEESQLNPNGDYAQTKLEAENFLLSFFKDSDVEVIVLRPPLIYGKKAPGNYKSLESAISKHIPIPLGSVNNQRSFLFVENLVWTINRLIECEKPVGGVYNVTDGEYVSTSYFLKNIAKHFKFSLIIPFPTLFLKIIGKILRRSTAVNKLTCDLSFDTQKISKVLGSKPQYSMSEALELVYKGDLR